MQPSSAPNTGMPPQDPMTMLRMLAQTQGMVQGQPPMATANMATAIRRMAQGQTQPNGTASYDPTDSGMADEEHMLRSQGQSPTGKALSGMAQDANAMLDNFNFDSQKPGDRKVQDYIMQNYQWEGKNGVPTARDKKFVDTFPTDSIVEEFDMLFNKGRNSPQDSENAREDAQDTSEK